MGIKINYANEISGGEYSNRMLEKSKYNYQMPAAEEETRATQALAEQLKGVTVTMSPESIEYMENLEIRKAAERAAKEQAAKEWTALKQDDPFGMYGGMRKQCIVISEALAEQGFYENKSDEEVLEIESLLADITYGMNNINSFVRLVPEQEELSSAAARFELESSTAALKQFAEKYVPESMRESFNDLIQKYYDYNAKGLERYQPVKEWSNKAQLQSYERQGNVQAVISDEERMNHMAARVRHSDEEKASATKEWKEYFETLMKGGEQAKSKIDRMGDMLKKYASGNSSNTMFLRYIEAWNKDSVENAMAYWSKLV